MRYRQLGDTDLIVSRICFGCWQLSPRFRGNVDLERWRAAIVGVKEPSHITGIACAADGELSQRGWHNLAGIVKDD